MGILSQAQVVKILGMAKGSLLILAHVFYGSETEENEKKQKVRPTQREYISAKERRTLLSSSLFRASLNYNFPAFKCYKKCQLHDVTLIKG